MLHSFLVYQNFLQRLSQLWPVTVFTAQGKPRHVWACLTPMRRGSSPMPYWHWPHHFRNLLFHLLTLFFPYFPQYFTSVKPAEAQQMECLCSTASLAISPPLYLAEDYPFLHHPLGPVAVALIHSWWGGGVTPGNQEPRVSSHPWHHGYFVVWLLCSWVLTPG